MKRPAFLKHFQLRSALTLMIAFLFFLTAVVAICEVWVFRASSRDIERMVINDREQCFNALIDSSSVKVTRKNDDRSFYGALP